MSEMLFPEALSQRVIASSCKKIVDSRNQKISLGLHKDLLVTRMLHRAQQLAMLSMSYRMVAEPVCVAMAEVDQTSLPQISSSSISPSVTSTSEGCEVETGSKLFTQMTPVFDHENSAGTASSVCSSIASFVSDYERRLQSEKAVITVENRRVLTPSRWDRRRERKSFASKTRHGHQVLKRRRSGNHEHVPAPKVRLLECPRCALTVQEQGLKAGVSCVCGEKWPDASFATTSNLSKMRL